MASADGRSVAVPARRAALVALVAGAWLSACDSSAESPAPTEADAAAGSPAVVASPVLERPALTRHPRNLLLITVDTLRADHLGFMGYPRPTSPALDRVAEESVVFERTQSTSSWTLPAMASLMTSRAPSVHGVVDPKSSLPEDLVTLGEALSAAGFHCGAFTSNLFMSRAFGFQQGFSEYENFVRGRQRPPGGRGRQSARAVTSDVITEKGIAWLTLRAAESDGPPWLLWLHYFDPHADYARHPGLTEVFGHAAPVDAYDGEVAFVDLQIGLLLGALDSLGLARDTALVFTADHGEEFHDHGDTGHRKTLFQEVVHVPLMLRVPDIAPARVRERVSLLDVAPTIREVLSLPEDAEAAGRSLVPLLLRGELPPRPLMAELSVGADLRLASVVLGDMKLIEDETSKALHLYDLAADPGESRNLARERPLDTARLAELLEQAARKSGLAHPAPGAAVLDADGMEELRALGYVGAAGPSPAGAQAALGPAR